MRARVTVVTAGHLATCPRMVKAADALHEAGYRVRVISVRSTAWAAPLDGEVHARRGWAWEVVAYDRASTLRWLATGVRFRASQSMALRLGRARPYALSVAAFSRAHAEIVRAILRDPHDFVYGGTSGALAAVAEAARRSGTPYALDLEDFHCEEHDATPLGSLRDALAGDVMQEATRRASFVTAGSAAIARACARRFGIAPATINNTFRLPPPPPASARDGGPLRLYWFSQTVGPRRGLEQVVQAAGMARVDAELHLRGVPAEGYLSALGRRASAVAPRLRIVHHPPAPPDAMVEACRPFDVGLAVENGGAPNSALTLSNKALTYPLAGLALALTDTPGQRPLVEGLANDAAVFAPGDVAALAERLGRWSSDAGALRRAKHASWEAARARWHWEHELERGALLERVARVVA